MDLVNEHTEYDQYYGNASVNPKSDSDHVYVAANFGIQNDKEGSVQITKIQIHNMEENSEEFPVEFDNLFINKQVIRERVRPQIV